MAQDKLTKEINEAEEKVEKSKGNSKEALNKAHATVRFLCSIMAGLRGVENISEITFCRY